MKYLFIVNPKSGKRKGDRVRLIIEQFCADHQLQFDIWRWDEPYLIDSLLQKVIASDFDVVTACGGDGTIHQVASRLIGSDKILGIIPIGTGNALANHFGIPRNPHKALQVLLTGKAISIDTAQINGVPYVAFCGFGLDAQVACRYSTVKRRNFFTYAYFTLKFYWDHRPESTQIVVNNQKMEWNPHVLTVSNIAQFGMKTVFAPGASASDGKLDLFGIWIKSPFHVPLLVWHVFRGTIGKSKYYQKVQDSEFQLIRKRSDIAQIDGEPFFTEKNINIKVIPNSLKIIVPQETSEF
jgi:YegS/Rv2252/BmrU family lipid kinase